jgi:cold shock CspA family protein
VIDEGRARDLLGSREFGFLQPDDGGPDVLVHARNFVHASAAREGALCEFDLVPDRNRRSGYRAEKVMVL